MNFENFKKFGNSDLEILIFRSMFLYHVMIQMYSPSVAKNGQYNSNHILKCNFISFLFNYITDFISHNYQGPADFTVPARASPSAHPDSMGRTLNTVSEAFLPFSPFAGHFLAKVWISDCEIIKVKKVLHFDLHPCNVFLEFLRFWDFWEVFSSVESVCANVIRAHLLF